LALIILALIIWPLLFGPYYFGPYGMESASDGLKFKQSEFLL